MTIALNGLGLSKRALTALSDARAHARDLVAGERLVAEGDESAGLYVVLTGILKSYRALQSGGAQTLALFTTGDLVGLQGFALGRETAALAAVSATRVAVFPAGRLRALFSDHPELGPALWRAMAREATILQEWMVGMGRRTAQAQIAHLLCEIAVRMRIAGRVNGDVYEFPLTQIEVADAVGLSSVHVNRILQNLRFKGLIALGRGQLRIGDWDRLAEAADFDPGYLGLRPPSGEQDAALLFSSGEPEGAGDRRTRESLP